MSSNPPLAVILYPCVSNTTVMIIMMAVDMSSNPPLAVILHPCVSNTTLPISFRNQGLDEVVLSRATTLVHVNQPPTMELAENSGIIICNLLIHPAKQDALNLVIKITDHPTIRAVVGVLA